MNFIFLFLFNIFFNIIHCANIISLEPFDIKQKIGGYLRGNNISLEQQNKIKNLSTNEKKALLFSCCKEALIEQEFSSSFDGLAKILISALDDLNFDDYGITPLNMAIFRENYNVIEYLIKGGVDLNLRDKYNFTPLMKALDYSGFAVIKLLIDNGADIFASSQNISIVELASIKAEAKKGEGEKVFEYIKYKIYLLGKQFDAILKGIEYLPKEIFNIVKGYSDFKDYAQIYKSVEELNIIKAKFEKTMFIEKESTHCQAQQSCCVVS